MFPDIVERRKRELIEAQQKLEQERAQAAEAAAAARSASIKKRRISADVSLNNVISSATANDTNNGIETADNADSNPARMWKETFRLCLLNSASQGMSIFHAASSTAAGCLLQ